MAKKKVSTEPIAVRAKAQTTRPLVLGAVDMRNQLESLMSNCDLKVGDFDAPPTQAELNNYSLAIIGLLGTLSQIVGGKRGEQLSKFELDGLPTFPCLNIATILQPWRDEIINHYCRYSVMFDRAALQLGGPCRLGPIHAPNAHQLVVRFNDAFLLDLEHQGVLLAEPHNDEVTIPKNGKIINCQPNVPSPAPLMFRIMCQFNLKATPKFREIVRHYLVSTEDVRGIVARIELEYANAFDAINNQSGSISIEHRLANIQGCLEDLVASHSASKEPDLSILSPAQRRAFLLYQAAIAQSGDGTTIEESYETIKKMMDDSKVVTDGKLPTLVAYRRNLTRAKTKLAGAKNRPRITRIAGRSIATLDGESTLE